MQVLCLDSNSETCFIKNLGSLNGWVSFQSGFGIECCGSVIKQKADDMLLWDSLTGAVFGLRVKCVSEESSAAQTKAVVMAD